MLAEVSSVVIVDLNGVVVLHSSGRVVVRSSDRVVVCSSGRVVVLHSAGVAVVISSSGTVVSRVSVLNVDVLRVVKEVVSELIVGSLELAQVVENSMFSLELLLSIPVVSLVQPGQTLSVVVLSLNSVVIEETGSEVSGALDLVLVVSFVTSKLLVTQVGQT